MNPLFDLIKSQAETFLGNEPAVTPAQNDQIIEEAQTSITNGLKTMNPGQLELLQQDAASGTLNGDHPQVQGISSNFAESIGQKLGINSEIAQRIAAAVIPMVMGKVAGSGKGFNLDSILGGFTGNNNQTSAQTGSGLRDQLTGIGKQLGLDKDGDGDIDFDDLKKMF